MVLVNCFEENINVPVSFVSNDGFKDAFVDKAIAIRDAIRDKHDTMPVFAMSSNTFNWFRRVFQGDIGYVEKEYKTFFWGMDVRLMDAKDGLFDFYLDEESDSVCA